MQVLEGWCAEILDEILEISEILCKEIQKDVRVEYVHNFFDSSDTSVEIFCPSCGMSFCKASFYGAGVGIEDAVWACDVNNLRKYKRCYECGQRIKWPEVS